MSWPSGMFRSVLVLALILSQAATPAISSADCALPEDGRIVAILVQSCDAIDGRTNKEVLESAGKQLSPATIQKMYTGALVTDEKGLRWMYPSAEKDPCHKFEKGSTAKMKAYRTCCDTGRWGKCVFGGRWLGDVDGKPVNAFQ